MNPRPPPPSCLRLCSDAVMLKPSLLHSSVLLVLLLFAFLPRRLAASADDSVEISLQRAEEELGAWRQRRGYGKSDYLLPENFRSLRRKDIPVTYRLHDDLLRFYRKGTRPVTHPSKIVSVSMSVFLYQIIKLDAVKNTISLSGSFELVGLPFLPLLI
ncbi:hypothetical protein QR680_005499 [Steinernema hermaphroditum]|uniref:Neurotransmitter-gated ion-channel ligand-binding domain-containing protein n=1 Tax=Steinernema hermaphroditum TaxID=289476 RepID=A0AA39HUK9_9BILA|nr:hypothetical protein QR680_005499 [Steinernema hermaphroditum]